MAACGSLHHIFDKPLDTTTTPFDSISSWKHDNSSKPISGFSFLDMLSDPHFMNKSDSNNKDYFSTKETKPYQSNVNMNAESLFTCTEGLGFESFDDVEDTKTEENSKDRHEGLDTTTAKKVVAEIFNDEPKKSRIKGVEFPPPISSIGTSGKAWVCLKPYRNNGRFILKEVRIPTQELLRASREDGRLKLQYIQSDDESLYEEDEDENLNLDLDGDCNATREKETKDESL